MGKMSDNGAATTIAVDYTPSSITSNPKYVSNTFNGFDFKNSNLSNEIWIRWQLPIGLQNEAKEEK